MRIRKKINGLILSKLLGSGVGVAADYDTGANGFKSGVTKC